MPISSNWIPFTTLNILPMAPNARGVYELANRFNDGVIRTIYIGSTEVSLKQRLLQHADKSEPNVAIKRYAQFFRFEASDNPKILEKLLILEFQASNQGGLPLANRKI